MIICNYCGREAALVKGDKTYPHRPDLYEKYFYLCEPCNAYVGTHKNSKAHAPLGNLANADLRGWRRHVHKVFDPLWQDDKNRKDEYLKLADKMGLKRNKCHISMFDIEQCKLALKVLKVK